MRLVATKERFERMVNSVCCRGFVPEALVQIQENGIMSMNQDAGSTYMSYVRLSKNHFKALDGVSDTKVPFTMKYLESLKYGFSGDDDIEVNIADNKISLKGKVDKWEGDIPGNIDEEKTWMAKPFNEIDGVGYLPEGPVPFAQFLIHSSQLKMPPLGEVAKISTSADGKLIISVQGQEGQQRFQRELKPSKINATISPDKAIKLFIEGLNKLTSHFNDEVWVTLYDQVVSFSLTMTDLSVTFLTTTVL